nr:dihydrodipicolinate synthase family protein [Deltaproteobacteria bacterium]
MLFLVATLTPFDSRGRVDLGRLRAHVSWLAAQGVDGFVPTASAGELPYLSDREREAVHRTVLEEVAGRLVYPCAWDPSLQVTRYLIDAARDQGAAGVVVPPPLFYKVDD